MPDTLVEVIAELAEEVQKLRHERSDLQEQLAVMRSKTPKRKYNRTKQTATQLALGQKRTKTEA